MTVDGEAESSSQTQAPEAELRPSGLAEVPDPRPGSRREREGAGDPAVPGGADLALDEGPGACGGEPQAWQAPQAEVVAVHLGGPTAYTDYPAIPRRFERDFKIHILGEHADPTLLHPSVMPDEPERHSDVVSDTIRDLGMWEPPETIFACSAFSLAPEGAVFIDVGCHVGWYSLIAMSYGLDVAAYDGDARMLQLLGASALINDFGGLYLHHELIDSTWRPCVEADDAIVKIDIEGSEVHAINGLWPLFEKRRVSHLLMEVSPIFEDYYPELLGRLFELGYVGFAMPNKMEVPPTFDSADQFLRRHCRRLDNLTRGSMSDWVQDQSQFNAIIFRPDAKFG